MVTSDCFNSSIKYLDKRGLLQSNKTLNPALSKRRDFSAAIRVFPDPAQPLINARHSPLSLLITKN